MPAMSEIIKLNLTVSSASVTRQGFNSILLVGDETMINSAVFTEEHMVKEYVNFESIGTDISGDLLDMALIAFGQTPSVTRVYVSYVDTEGSSAGILTSDLLAIQANSNDWFGYCSTFNTDSDITVQMGFLGTNDKYGSFLKKDSVAVSGASNYAALWHTKTASGSAQWVNVAWLSTVLALTPGSYTGAFLQLQLVDPSTYTSTEETALRAAAINQFSAIGGVNVTWNGVSATGGTNWADIYIGAVYLQVRMMEDLANLLIQSLKVPLNDSGIAQVEGVMKRRLDQSTTDGYLDPERPFVIAVPDASELTDRASRVLPNVGFTAFASVGIQVIEIQGLIDAT